MSPEAAEARSDAAVVVVLPREPEQLDPRFIGDAYGLKLSRLIHASLVRVDPQTFEPVLDLAQQIEIPTPTRYEVTLREGLRFADGSTLDAHDVVATYRALVDPKVGSRYQSTYSRIRRVSADGARRVVFELDAAHATFLTDLEMPVLRGEDAFRPAGARGLVGAGPYRLLSKRSGCIELGPNRHSRVRPAHPKLRFLVVRDDNTRALRMLAGAGDLAQNVIPPLLLPLFQNDAFRVASAPGPGTTYLGVNLTHPVLSDVRVRRALAHALDRSSLIRYKLAGRARLARGWIVPGHWAYAEDTPSYEYDPARARALLAQAGIAPQGDGSALTMTLRTGSDRGAVSMSRAIASMLMQVGIEVDVRPSETATLLHDLSRGRFMLTLLQVPEVFEPHVLSWFFGSDRIPDPGKQEGGNRWRFRSAELDALLEAGRSTVDRAQRAAIYRQAQHVLARALPVIPLWHEDVVAVTSPRLRDYVVPRDARFGLLAGSQPCEPSEPRAGVGPCRLRRKAGEGALHGE